jgi:hypothetical protein
MYSLCIYLITRHSLYNIKFYFPPFPFQGKTKGINAFCTTSMNNFFKIFDYHISKFNLKLNSDLNPVWLKWGTLLTLLTATTVPNGNDNKGS